MADQIEYEPYHQGEMCTADSHAECPHCHCVWHPDDWYPGDYDTLETECPECGAPLMLTSTIRVTIYAAKAISKEAPDEA